MYMSPRTMKRLLKSTSAVMAFMITALYTGAFALPTGWEVIEGNATFEVSDNVLTITSTADKTVINYISFNLSSGETINFIMPGAGGTIINQVIGGGISNIAGTINANGTIGIINTAGIAIANSAQINAASFLASTLNVGIINNDSIALDGGNGKGIVNEGEINIANGGYAILAGAGVNNMGSIIAEDGTINLAVGDSMTFHLSNNTVVDVTIDEGISNIIAEMNAGINNSGNLEANRVDLTTKLADNVIAQAVNNEGIITATSLNNVGGRIIVQGQGGESTVTNSGDLLARGDSGASGGTIHVLGDHLRTNGATLDASGDAGGGQILIGGEFQGKGDTYTATTNHIDADTIINVNSNQNGDGGEAIVWADDYTEFHGTALARGGDISGDGGLIEISGKKDLLYNRTLVDTRAGNGETGMLLLDPTNIDIRNNGGTDNPGIGRYYEDNLEADSVFTNITLTADRDIRMRNLSDNTLSLTNSLTLNAGRDIYFDSTGDTIASFAGSVTFVAGDDIRDIGTVGALSGVNLTASDDIDVDTILTDGSNVVLNAGGDIAINDVTTNFYGGNGGSITLNANNNITFDDLTTGNANINISADHDANGSGNVDIVSGSIITSNGGNVNLWGEEVQIQEDINTGGGNFSLIGNRDNAGGDGFTDFDNNAQIVTGGGSFYTQGAEVWLNHGGDINTGTGTVTVVVTDDSATDVFFDDGFTITAGDVNITSAGTVEFNDNNDRITSSGTVNISGNIIEMNSTGSISSTGGSVTINSNGDLELPNNITTSGFGIQLNADNDLNGAGIIDYTTGETIDSNGGNVTIRGEYVQIQKSIDTDGGIFTGVGDRNNSGNGYFDFDSGAGVTTDGGAVNLTSTNYWLNDGGFINAGAGDVTITGTADSANDVYFDDFQVSGRQITIDTPGQVVFNDNDDSISATSNISITGDAIVDFNDQGSVTTTGTQVLIRSNGDIDLADTISSNGGLITIDADADSSGAGSITFTNANDIDANGANVIMRGENINFESHLDTDGGDFTALTDRNGNGNNSFNFNGAGRITTDGGDVSITAPTIFLDNGQSINAGTGDITITDTTDTASDITFDNGFDLIGRDITLDSPGVVFFNNGGDSIQASRHITVTGDTAVDFNDQGLVSSTGGNITINTNAAIDFAATTSTNGGNITFNADQDLNGTGTLTIDAANTITTNGGDMTFRGETINFNRNLNSAGGDIIAVANRDLDNFGAIDFNNNAHLTSGNGDVNLTGSWLWMDSGGAAGITAGNGDIVITSNGGADAQDIYINQGFDISGRNITLTTDGDIGMNNGGDSINASGWLYLDAGLSINATAGTIDATGDIFADAGTTVNADDWSSSNGNLGIYAGGNIAVSGAGVSSGGNVGWNGARDETLVLWSQGGDVSGTNISATGLGNMRIQAGSTGACGTCDVNVSNVSTAGNLSLFARGANGGTSINMTGGTNSIGGNLTATSISASNNFAATSGDINITANSDIDSAMVWSGDDITLTSTNGSITQDAAYYGTGFNNNITIMAGDNIDLRASGTAGSHIDAGVMTLDLGGATTNNVTAQASGVDGSLSIRMYGRVDGDLSATNIGGASNTVGNVRLGTTLGGSVDNLDDTDFVMDVRGNLLVRSGGDVSLYGGFAKNGTATIYGDSLYAELDKWDFNINLIQTTNTSGNGIDIKAHKGSILGANLTTAGAANAILEAGTYWDLDKDKYIQLNNVNTGGNLTITVTGSDTGNAAGSSVSITGSTGGMTTVTDELGGAPLGSVTTP